MNEGVTGARIYLDANVFIYAIEGEPSLAEPLQSLFLAASKTPGIKLVTSELSLAEVLCKNGQSDATARLYLDLMISSKVVSLQGVTRQVLLESARLRQEIAPFKLADAIHAASAVQAECALFMSMDGRLTKLPSRMQKIVADQSGVDIAMRALHD